MEINGKRYIPIKEWAASHGLKANTIVARALRGSAPEVVKLGRDYFCPADMALTDARVKDGKYKDWRKKRG